MMGATSNEAKRRWNAGHYAQVKVSVPPDLAAAFKAKCAAVGVSMASEISRFMSGEISGRRKAMPPEDLFETRPQRRKALSAMIVKLEKLMDAEQNYLGNIPENLQGSRFYDAAEHAVSSFEEALAILSEAY
jgi:hypothetical protein